jgi:hypothetical protein
VGESDALKVKVLQRYVFEAWEMKTRFKWVVVLEGGILINTVVADDSKVAENWAREHGFEVVPATAEEHEVRIIPMVWTPPGDIAPKTCYTAFCSCGVMAAGPSAERGDMLAWRKKHYSQFPVEEGKLWFRR